MFHSLWLFALLVSCRIESAYAAIRSYNLNLHSNSRAPDGFDRQVYLINNQQTGPLIEADEGDILEVVVQNELDVENTIHWHGLLQRGTPHMDGVPGVTQFPIRPNGNFTYRVPLKDQYGFYWYHSHFKTYYNDAVRGPLLIHPSPSRPRPFAKLAQSKTELSVLLQVERNATPVLLADWYHNLSNMVYNQYSETGAFPNCVDSLLANGMGRVQCLPWQILQAGPSLGLMSPSSVEAASSTGVELASMTMHSSSDSTHVMRKVNSESMDSTSSTTMAMKSGMMSSNTLGPRGCSPPTMFKPGYNISSLPPETCTNTTSPLLTIAANHSQGWLALHLVNAGATSKLSVSLDAHSMFVYAADGLYVDLQEVKVLPISIGQRYSVMIRLDQTPGQYYLRFATFPVGDMQQVMEDQAIVAYTDDTTPRGDSGVLYDDQKSTWMLVNGSAKNTSFVLDEGRLAPFEHLMPRSGVADHTTIFTINQTDIVTWVLSGSPYTEPKTPIIYGNKSDGWAAETTLHMPFNSTIDIIMQIANDSMDTMGHPMHLHGHKFWVLGTGTGSFPYPSVVDAPQSIINLQNPPYRDTVELPASGWAVIRYITDNPGAWLFHCHIQWHLVSGMALVLLEGGDQLPSLVGAQVNASKPSMPGPSTTTSTAAVLPVAKPEAVLALVLLSMFFMS